MNATSTRTSSPAGAARATADRGGGPLTGTGRLVRLALRRDRIQLPVWVAGLGLLTYAQAGAVAALYDTPEKQVGYARGSVGSPVAAAFNGPVAGAEQGAIVMAESYFLLAVLIPLMCAFAVVRHSRQNEETGRAELIGAGVVGRHAPLTAALLVAGSAAVAVAAVIVLAFLAVGLPPAGSLAAGAAFGSAGLVFAGIAAVTAQVSDSARSANGLAAGAMGLAFLLRAVGDATGQVSPDGLALQSNWPTWLSPLGWVTLVRPFVADAWWVLALPVALFAGCTVLAFRLTARRDVGSGLLPARGGPPRAAPGLLSPLGLAWRLQRGTLLIWLLACLVFSAAFGALASQIDDFLAGNPESAEMIVQLGGSANLVESFLATSLMFFSLAAAGYVVQSLLRLRAEETGPLESVLAAAVGRPRWMAGHLAVATGGVLALMLAAGAGIGLAHGISVGEPLQQLGRMLAASLAYVPAVLVIGAVAALLFAVRPRLAAPAAWAVMVLCLLVYQVGALLELPQAVLDVSPFAHTPLVPSVPLRAAPVVVLTAVAVLLAAAAVALFRRRDLKP